MPKSKSIDISRLCQAMHKARLALKQPRVSRLNMVRQYVGRHWSEEGPKERVPCNLIGLWVGIISRHLISQNPRVMLSSFDRGLKPTVSAMEKWANQEIERMKFAETMERCVIDAFFSEGICKVALPDVSQSASWGWLIPAGKPFAEQIDPDDWVYDVACKDYRQAGYMGHRYRVPLDVVKDARLFSKKARDALVAGPPQQFNAEGDERIGILGRTTYVNQDEGFEDYIDLWEIYLPRHRLVVTLADDMLSGAYSTRYGEEHALRIQPWIGPASGPYHFLGMAKVPGNARPKAPIQDLIDIHEEVNAAYRKIMRTVRRIKEVTAVQGGASEDGSRLLKADDGEIIKLDHPDLIKQFMTSGTTLQALIPSATTMKDLFNWVGGNVEMIGGLAAQSKTVGQDELLAKNSSGTVQSYQERTVTFVSEVIKALCWYWWHDPRQVQKSIHSLPGLPNIQTVRKVTPEDRAQGQFEDLDIRVDPYSMQHATPQSRMAALNQIVTTVVLPMMQLMVQQGVNFDINKYLSKIGQYMDLPDLGEIMTIMEVNAAQTGSAPEGPMKAPVSQRTYTRENRSSATPGGQDRNMVTTMLGKIGQNGMNGKAG